MIRTRIGRVLSIDREYGPVVELTVEVEGASAGALCYPPLTGSVAAGDEVLLNTTAMALSLGSGGKHFVIANLSSPQEMDFKNQPGHIIKMNYTPLQCKVVSCEEEDSPHRDAMLEFDTLELIPVLAGNLHSMVAPVCAALRLLLGEAARVAYIMTDASCLPMAFSQTVRKLKEKGLIVGTVSYGHTFGGDVEAVNKFSAMAAARQVLGANVIVAAMGVGSIGTGTRYGFSGIEQGEVLNAASALGGTPVAIPRISFADARPRHYGVSHHTLTALGKVALMPAVFPLPLMDSDKMELALSQLEAVEIPARHRVMEYDGQIAIDALKEFGLEIKTMGRGPDKDREFFLACGAAARAAADLVV